MPANSDPGEADQYNPPSPGNENNHTNGTTLRIRRRSLVDAFCPTPEGLSEVPVNSFLLNATTKQVVAILALF